MTVKINEHQLIRLGCIHYISIVVLYTETIFESKYIFKSIYSSLHLLQIINIYLTIIRCVKMTGLWT